MTVTVYPSELGLSIKVGDRAPTDYTMPEAFLRLTILEAAGCQVVYENPNQ